MIWIILISVGLVGVGAILWKLNDGDRELINLLCIALWTIVALFWVTMAIAWPKVYYERMAKIQEYNALLEREAMNKIQSGDITNVNPDILPEGL